MLHNMIIKTDDEPFDQFEHRSALEAQAAREGQAPVNMHDFINERKN